MKNQPLNKKQTQRRIGLLAVLMLLLMACAPTEAVLPNSAETLPTAEPLATPTLVPTIEADAETSEDAEPATATPAPTATAEPQPSPQEDEADQEDVNAGEADADEPDKNLNAADEKPLAPVDSFDITLLETTVTQARLAVRGAFNDGCGKVGYIEQDLEENTIYVTLEMAPPDPAEACLMAITPYEQLVELDIAGFYAGDYRVVVNGIEGSLTLDTDIPAAE